MSYYDYEDDGIIIFFFGIVIALIVVGLLVGLGYIMGQEDPNKYGRGKAICEQYLGGDYHDDICILDGKVVSTKHK
jgi:hypothetical protein